MKKLKKDEKKMLEGIDIEKLDDEQLEMVNGGYLHATLEDARVLYSKGVLGEKLDISDFFFHWISSSEKVDNAWGKIGVNVITKPSGENVYAYNGRQITHEEALARLG